MTPLFMLVAALVFIAVFLVGFTFISRAAEGERALVRRRIAATGPYGIGSVVQEELSRSLYDRVVAPFVQGIGDRLARLTPASMVESTRQRLIQAGRRSPSAHSAFFAGKAVLMFGLPLLYVAGTRIATGSWPTGILQIVLVLALVYVGWRIPDFWLDFVINGRKKEIVRALPDALDLLTICVEAGLGFDAAFNMVAEKFSGPLAEEVALTMYEISLGKRRRDALHDLGQRVQAPELTSFLTAIIRAEQTGMNVGDVLRVQADGMRVRRRQRAQEQAQQAPVKMLFPLIIGIFPALFIVILAPAIILALQVLRGS